MKLSIIITTRNEERNIRDLLDSLVIQEKPFEVLVVDSHSSDNTQEIVKRYAVLFPFIKLLIKGGTRGQSRNFGVKVADSDYVAFIDGDCIANPFWLRELRRALNHSPIAAGKTINIGYHAFEDLDRVELHYRGVDLTFPSCNLAYRKDVFEEAGGFDTSFVTAEDIDLNFRAVSKGHKIRYNENAIVYHRARGSFIGFFKQAFWNGYGRKQLTSKHGSLWGNYRSSGMLKRSITPLYLARLVVAFLGYSACKFFGGLKTRH